MPLVQYRSDVLWNYNSQCCHGMMGVVVPQQAESSTRSIRGWVLCIAYKQTCNITCIFLQCSDHTYHVVVLSYLSDVTGRYGRSPARLLSIRGLGVNCGHIIAQETHPVWMGSVEGAGSGDVHWAHQKTKAPCTSCHSIHAKCVHRGPCQMEAKEGPNNEVWNSGVDCAIPYLGILLEWHIY